MAGVLGALEYFEWVGTTFGVEHAAKYTPYYTGRRLHFKQAMAAIRAYEYELSRSLLSILNGIPGLTVHGLSDLRRLEERVPTVSFTLQGWSPRHIAAELDKSGLYVWDGNYYALAVTERLGLEGSGGMLRVGPVHYNTLDEIARFGEAMRRIASQKDR
jgi:selenocysteine lyase/cysteine desulfurase